MKDQNVYNLVRCLPPGKVTTYADLGRLLGNRYLARAVGNALHRNPDGDRTACFRVLNAGGKTAPGFVFGGPEEQASRLLADGVAVQNGRVEMLRYRWAPSVSDPLLCLRPHHLLCCLFFRGIGYSESFTSAMKEVCHRLETEDCVLVCGGDVLCAVCPHYVADCCSCGGRAERYDAQVLKLLNREYGDRISAGERRELLKKEILDPDFFASVCSDCEWAYICHAGEITPSV